MERLYVLLIFAVFIHQVVFSQTDDLTGLPNQEKDDHQREQQSIKKSTLCSMILPGLGQIKNKKAWKVPIIYGMASGLIFSSRNNNTNYQFFRSNFLAEVDNSSSTVNTTNLNAAQLERRVSFFRRNRDLSYILLGVLYFVNIIDAHVDAHFRDFDVSNKLTLGIKSLLEESLMGEYRAVALVLKFNR